MKSRVAFRSGLLVGLLLGGHLVQAQSVDPFYAGHYSIRSISNILTVPRFLGGVVIRTNNPNVMLVAGESESPAAKIYQVTLQRGADGHITNFTGTATVFANTPGASEDGNPPWTGLSGDWDFGPNGVLFYLSPDNSLGQIKSGFTSPAKHVDMGVAAGITVGGGVVTVPAGLPGAGRFKFLAASGSAWYDVPLTSDGSGTYNVGSPAATVALVGIFPFGAVYVPAGTAGFANASIVLCHVSGSLLTYEVNSNGDPLPATVRTFVTGLVNPTGVSRDPVTGDFIFTSFDDTEGFYVVGNFAPAPLPSVTIINPTNGAKFTAPAGFDVTAIPSTPGGTVADVKIYQNSVPISTNTIVPYSALVGGLPAGSYNYQAIVTDGIGRMATSSVVSVTVTNPTPNVPPSVTLTNPINNSTIFSCTGFRLLATASDLDGAVTKVEFYAGNTLLGQSLLAPYVALSGELAEGTHALTARAYDDDGAVTTSSVVNVTITAPPLNTLIARVNSSNQLECCFTGQANSNYVLQVTTNLQAPVAWAPVRTNGSSTGVMRFTDPSVTNRTRGFYRTQRLP